MANKTLFKSLIGKLMPATDALNEERAPAYALAPKHQLAQYAATGCLNRKPPPVRTPQSPLVPAHSEIVSAQRQNDRFWSFYSDLCLTSARSKRINTVTFDSSWSPNRLIDFTQNRTYLYPGSVVAT